MSYERGGDFRERYHEFYVLHCMLRTQRFPFLFCLLF